MRPKLDQLKRWSHSADRGGPAVALEYPGEFLTFLHTVATPSYHREQHAGRARHEDTPIATRVRKLLSAVEDGVSSSFIPRSSELMHLARSGNGSNGDPAADAEIREVSAEAKQEAAEWLAEEPAESDSGVAEPDQETADSTFMTGVSISDPDPEPSAEQLAPQQTSDESRRLHRPKDESGGTGIENQKSLPKPRATSVMKVPVARTVMGGGFSAIAKTWSSNSRQVEDSNLLQPREDRNKSGSFRNKLLHRSASANVHRGSRQMVESPLIAVGSVNVRQVEEDSFAPMNELQINRRATVSSVEHPSLKTRSSAIEAALGSLAGLWRPDSLGTFGTNVNSIDSGSTWLSSGGMPARGRSTFTSCMSATVRKPKKQSLNSKRPSPQRSASACAIQVGRPHDGSEYTSQATRAQTITEMSPEDGAERQEYRSQECRSRGWSSPFMKRRTAESIKSAGPSRTPTRTPTRSVSAALKRENATTPTGRPSTAFEQRGVVCEERSADREQERRQTEFIPHAKLTNSRPASSVPRDDIRTIEHEHKKIVRNVMQREGLKPPPEASVYLHSRPSTAANQRHKEKRTVRRPATAFGSQMSSVVEKLAQSVQLAELHARADEASPVVPHADVEIAVS